MAEEIRGLYIELAADGTKTNKSLKEIEANLKTTKSELKALKEGLKLEWDNTKFKRAQELAQKALSDTAKKVEILQARYNYLKNTDNLTDKQKAEFEKLRKEIAYTDNELVKMKKQLQEINSLKIDNLSKNIEKLGTSIEGTGKKMLGLTAAITAGATLSAKAAIEYESAFAGVRKTVDATEEEYSNLSDKIIELSKIIPTSAKEIAAVAEVAGQLGIKKENILEFSKTIIDLSNSTNLLADEGASDLAKFLNITGSGQETISNLGSSIVALGNNYATTERDIVSMATNLASAGKQVGMSDSQILALATSLSSVGLESQAGGTAFSKALTEIQLAVETNSKDLERWANTSGMTTKEFARLFKEDATSALQAFIKGLSDAGVESESAIKILDDMGITETRMRDALLRSANASDVLTSAINVSNTAYKENAALVDEANKRYATTESQLQMTKNQITANAIEIGNMLLPTIKDLTDGVKDLTEWFSSLDEETKKNTLKILALTAAIGPLLIAGGNAIKLVSSVISGIKNLYLLIAAHPFTALATAIAAVTTATILYTSAMTDASDEVKALAKNVDDLAESYDNAKKSAKENEDAEIAQLNVCEKLIPKLEELATKTNRTETENKSLNDIISKLNSSMPNLELAIDNETGALNNQIDVIYEMVTAYKDLAKAKGAQAIAEESMTSLVKAEKLKADLENEIKSKNYNIEYYSQLGKNGWGGDVSLSEYLGASASLSSETTSKNLVEKKLEEVNKQIAEYNKDYEDYMKIYDESYLRYSNAKPRTYDKDFIGPIRAQDNYESATIVKSTAEDILLKSKVDSLQSTAEEKIKTEDEKKEREKQYEEEVDELKYKLDLELITELEYYDELAKLRNEYLEKDSAEWRSVEVEIYNFKKKLRNQEENDMKEVAKESARLREEKNKQLQEAREEEIKSLEKVKEASIKNLREQYNTRVEYINRELNAEENRINKLLENIDKEENARSRSEQENDLDKKIAIAEAQARLSRTSEDVTEWQKELIRLKQEKEDMKRTWALDDEKQKLKDELLQKQAEAEQQINKLNNELEFNIEKVTAKTEEQIANLTSKTVEVSNAMVDTTVDALSAGIKAIGDTALEYIKQITQKANELATTTKAGNNASPWTGDEGKTTNNYSSNVTVNNNGGTTWGTIGNIVTKVTNALLGRG